MPVSLNARRPHPQTPESDAAARVAHLAAEAQQAAAQLDTLRKARELESAAREREHSAALDTMRRQREAHMAELEAELHAVRSATQRDREIAAEERAVAEARGRELQEQAAALEQRAAELACKIQDFEASSSQVLCALP